MNEEYKVYWPKAIVVAKDETNPMWAPEGATYIEQVDEGGGVFLEISQLDVHDREQKIRVTYAELEQVYAVARRMQIVENT